MNLRCERNERPSNHNCPAPFLAQCIVSKCKRGSSVAQASDRRVHQYSKFNDSESIISSNLVNGTRRWNSSAFFALGNRHPRLLAQE